MNPPDNERVFADIMTALRAERIRRRWSQVDTAALIGCAVKQLIAWENGHAEPRGPGFLRWLAAFDLEFVAGPPPLLNTPAIVTATQHEVSCLPPGHPDRAAFTIVMNLHPDHLRWLCEPGHSDTVTAALNTAGGIDYRTDPHDMGWIDAHCFDWPVALGAAMFAAPRMGHEVYRLTDGS